jgi:hypothetical protein
VKRRIALTVWALFTLGACAHGRTEREMSATVFASFSVQGTERGTPFYQPAQWTYLMQIVIFDASVAEGGRCS